MGIFDSVLGILPHVADVRAVLHKASEIISGMKTKHDMFGDSGQLSDAATLNHIYETAAKYGPRSEEYRQALREENESLKRIADRLPYVSYLLGLCGDFDAFYVIELAAELMAIYPDGVPLYDVAVTHSIGNYMTWLLDNTIKRLGGKCI